MIRRRIGLEYVLVGALTLMLGGCIAATVGAAAGAAGAIAYTERGASSQVNASVTESAAASEGVFQELDIAVTERTTGDGSKFALQGDQDDMRVNVEIARKDSGVSEIEVTARRSAINYDKDYARSVLRMIIARL